MIQEHVPSCTKCHESTAKQSKEKKTTITDIDAGCGVNTTKQTVERDFLLCASCPSCTILSRAKLSSRNHENLNCELRYCWLRQFRQT